MFLPPSGMKAEEGRKEENLDLVGLLQFLALEVLLFYVISRTVLGVPTGPFHYDTQDTGKSLASRVAHPTQAHIAGVLLSLRDFSPTSTTGGPHAFHRKHAGNLWQNTSELLQLS